MQRSLKEHSDDQTSSDRSSSDSESDQANTVPKGIATPTKAELIQCRKLAYMQAKQNKAVSFVDVPDNPQDMLQKE
eukprot:15350871-Ditylum_brightwellii.AAC.1